MFSSVLEELDRYNQRGLTTAIVLVYVYLNGTISADKVSMFMNNHVYICQWNDSFLFLHSQMNCIQYAILNHGN